MKCPFCLGDGKKTREHLFSNAVFNAVGLDRSVTVASVDPRTGDFRPLTSLNERKVRLPCEDCNSGWMSALETETADLLRQWTASPSTTLGSEGLLTLTRWLVKTMFVLTFAELGARGFMEKPTESAIPDVTSARTVAAGNVPDLAVVGAARVDPADSVLWSVGNADVQPVGPDLLNSRAVNVAALSLNGLQLWVALPVVRPDGLKLPTGVMGIQSDSTMETLPRTSGGMSPTAVKVTYDQRTSRAFFAAIELLQ